MSNAFGGLTNIVIIVVFLVLVMGYLAFNVQYSKAFKVKNTVITTLEQYEGKCDRGSRCDEKIQNYINQVGYGTKDIRVSGNCPTGANGSTDDYHCNNGYCYCKVLLETSTDDIYKNITKEYYHVVTHVELNIPIINNVLSGLRFFEVSGDSKPVSKFKVGS